MAHSILSPSYFPFIGIKEVISQKLAMHILRQYWHSAEDPIFETSLPMLLTLFTLSEIFQFLLERPRKNRRGNEFEGENKKYGNVKVYWKVKCCHGFLQVFVWFLVTCGEWEMEI